VIGAQGIGMSVVGNAGAQLPPVDVPDLPIPDLPVPDVPVPDLPPVPVPVPQPPPPPPTPAPALPAVPSVPSAPAPPSGSSPGSASAPSGGSSGASGGGATPPAGSTAATPAPASPAARARRSADPAPGGEPSTRERSARRKQQRRVRDTVRRLAGCLGDLPRREIRVLVLRAGIGPGPALSRERVGDRLDLATQRVARLERRGVRHLRAAASDGCGGAGAGAGTAVVETVLAAAAAGGSLPAAPGAERTADPGAGGGSGGGEDQPRSGVKGEFDSSGSGGSRTPAVSVPPVGPDGGGGAEGLSIAALLLGLALLGYAVRRELRSGGGPTAG
jgi:hypothetical protein